MTDDIDLMMGESKGACGCYTVIELGIRYSHFFLVAVKFPGQYQVTIHVLCKLMLIIEHFEKSCLTFIEMK